MVFVLYEYHTHVVVCWLNNGIVLQCDDTLSCLCSRVNNNWSVFLISLMDNAGVCLFCCCWCTRWSRKRFPHGASALTNAVWQMCSLNSVQVLVHYACKNCVRAFNYVAIFWMSKVRIIFYWLLSVLIFMRFWWSLLLFGCIQNMSTKRARTKIVQTMGRKDDADENMQCWGIRYKKKQQSAQLRCLWFAYRRW